jgi:hypothetical protein
MIAMITAEATDVSKAAIFVSVTEAKVLNKNAMGRYECVVPFFYSANTAGHRLLRLWSSEMGGEGKIEPTFDSGPAEARAMSFWLRANT